MLLYFLFFLLNLVWWNIRWRFGFICNILFILNHLSFSILHFFYFRYFFFCVMWLYWQSWWIVLHYKTALTHRILVFFSNTFCTYRNMHLWILYWTLLKSKRAFKNLLFIIYLRWQVYINHTCLFITFWSSHCKAKSWLF